jgi:hypothetical protein
MGKQQRILFAVALAIGLASTFFGAGPVKVSADSCTPNYNSIISCGFSSPTDFINQVKANNSGNGHQDLQAIYANYGLVPADYSKFAAYAEPGVAYRDNNTIVVTNSQGVPQTVATNTISIGRLKSYQGSNPKTYTIPDAGTFYGNYNDQAFASDHASLPVTVLFDNTGKMVFAVMDECGNPFVSYTPVTPNYSCDELHSTQDTSKVNTYDFSTAASAGNNAKIVKVVYNFDDGTSNVTEQSPTTVVPHTFKTTGSHNVSVTVYVTIPGSSQPITITSVKCTKLITIAAPYYSCLQLTGAIIDENIYNRSFTATASFGNGATFTSADFNFGDGSSKKVSPNGSSTSVTVTHSYVAGSYTASATLYFSAGGKAISVNCEDLSVTPTQPPTPECRAGVPEGSALCSTCATNSSIPANSSQCGTPPAAPTTPSTPTTPTALPNTGAGDVIGIFGVAAVVGFFLYRQFISRKHGFQMAGAGAPMTLATPVAPVHHHEPVHHTGTTARHDTRHPLSHPTYQRPHRFRPRSHRDGEQ